MKNGCPYPLIFFLIERKEVVLSSIWWETEKNHMRKYTAQHLFKQYTGYLFAISVGHLLEYVRPMNWLLTIIYSHCWALPRPKYQIRQRTSGQTAPITGVTSGPQLRAPAQPVVGGEKAWRGRQTLNVISVHVLATIGSNQRKRLLGKAQGQANWTPVRILVCPRTSLSS